MEEKLPAVGVFEPEAVGVADPRELLLDDGPEELSGSVAGLQHSSDVEVDVVQTVLVHGGELLQKVRPLGEELGVYVRPLLHAGESEVGPSRSRN